MKEPREKLEAFSALFACILSKIRVIFNMDLFRDLAIS